MVEHEGNALTDAELTRICSTWFSYQAVEDERTEWAAMRVEELLEGKDWTVATRVIRKLCETVDLTNGDLLEMVGAGPLESFIFNYGSDALDYVEGHVGACVAMQRALVYVSGRRNDDVLRRISQMRAQH